MKPIQDENSTFSAAGARIRLPNPTAAKPVAALQPTIPTGPGVKVRFPVNVQLAVCTSASPAVLSSGGIVQGKVASPEARVVYPPYKSITAVPVPIVNKSISSPPRAMKTVSIPKIAPDGRRTMLTPPVNTTGSDVSFIPSTVGISSPANRSTPTVTIQPGGQAVIFSPNQPLKMGSPTKGQFYFCHSFCIGMFRQRRNIAVLLSKIKFIGKSPLSCVLDPLVQIQVKYIVM